MLDTDIYTRMLFGEHAVRAPVQITIQPAGEGLYSAVMVTTGDLRFGGTLTHQLIIGDAVIRPALVMETDAYKAHGLAGLALKTRMHWKQDGRIVINPAGLEPDKWGW